MKTTLGCIVLGMAACAARPVPPGVPAPIVRGPAATVVVVSGGSQADTLVVSGAWSLPPVTDGRGPIDSITVVTVGWGGWDIQTYKAPFPTSSRVVFVLDGTSSYAGKAMVCVQAWRHGFRAGLNPPQDQNTPPPANCSPWVEWAVALPPPPMVTGVTATVVTKP